MDKRQRYSVKEAAPSLNNLSRSVGGERSGGEPQCSFMFGGLGDLRRETYLCKSPLKVAESGKKKRQAKANIKISIHFIYVLPFSLATPLALKKAGRKWREIASERPVINTATRQLQLRK